MTLKITAICRNWYTIWHRYSSWYKTVSLKCVVDTKIEFKISVSNMFSRNRSANMSNFIANQFDIHRCVIRLDRNYMRLTTPLIVYWRQNMFSYRLAYAQKEFLFNWTYLLLCNACCFTTDPLLSVLFYLLFFVIFSYNIMVNSRCSNSIQVKRKKTSHSRNTMIAQ